MTKEELAKVPFSCCGHVSMAHEHTTTYVNIQYGFKMVARTKVIKNGMGFGKTRREYYYDGKWYKKLDDFVEAINHVEFKG